MAVEAEAELRQALAFLRSGNPAGAEVTCRRLHATGMDGAGLRQVLGIALLEQQRPDEAVRELERALAFEPANPVVAYNLGNALAAGGRHAEAATAYLQALASQPAMLQARYNLGNALAASSAHADAISAFDQVLAAEPRFVEARNNRGRSRLALGDHVGALADFESVLALEPRHPAALVNRGAALLAADRHGEALAAYRQALAVLPGHAESMHGLGLALAASSQPRQAIEAFSAAIRQAPGFLEAWRQRANILRDTGDLPAAMADALQAIALRPESAEGYNLRGTIHHEGLRYAEALADYDRAITLEPGSADAWCNRGNALYDLGRLSDARAALVQALALAPGHAEATSNLGMVLQDMGDFEAARAAYDNAIALRPGNPESWKRRATLHLLRGDFGHGWADFEASARLAPHDPFPGLPRWHGGDPQGLSLLVHEPSGIGDAIQFLRYLPDLIDRGARVTFTGASRLFRLLASCDPRIVFIAQERIDPRMFDAQIDLWGLPRLLSPTLDAIPARVPYLHAEPDRVAHWRRWLGEGRRIGIAWQGRPGRKIDAGRSIPLAAFAPLASLPGIELVSLQRNEGTEQLAHLPPGMQVRDPGPAFDAGADAFLDTAAMMMALDLVVTSDTAVAHLAGALGRPVWVALKQVPEWRWMLSRSDTPWYPSMRLFRQDQAGVWEPVFRSMRRAWLDDRTDTDA